MSDIDLIPQAYRTRRWQVLWIKRFSFILGGLVGALALGATVIGIAAANATTRVEALQYRQSMTAQQRVDLERQASGAAASAVIAAEPA